MSRFFPAMNRRACPIFLYHGAAGNGGDAISDPLYSLSPASVRTQVSALRAAGCRSATLGEFLARGGACEGRCVITIDDGLASSAAVLFPALARAGFTAVIFPVAGMVDRRGWVDWAALSEMQRAGFEVGSHGMTHADLGAASPREVREELIGSKRLLEDRLGAPVRYLALPGGYRGHLTADFAVAAGYEAICGSRFGYNPVPADPMALRRFCIRRGDGDGMVTAVAAGEVRKIAGRLLRERGKELGRALFGRTIYAALRRRFIPAGAHASLPRFPAESDNDNRHTADATRTRNLQ